MRLDSLRRFSRYDIQPAKRLLRFDSLARQAALLSNEEQVAVKFNCQGCLVVDFRCEKNYSKLK